MRFWTGVRLPSPPVKNESLPLGAGFHFYSDGDHRTSWGSMISLLGFSRYREIYSCEYSPHLHFINP